MIPLSRAQREQQADMLEAHAQKIEQQPSNVLALMQHDTLLIDALEAGAAALRGADLDDGNREKALEIAFEQGYLCNRPGYYGQGARVAKWSEDVLDFRARGQRDGRRLAPYWRYLLRLDRLRHEGEDCEDFAVSAFVRCKSNRAGRQSAHEGEPATR